MAREHRRGTKRICLWWLLMALAVLPAGCGAGAPAEETGAPQDLVQGETAAVEESAPGQTASVPPEDPADIQDEEGSGDVKMTVQVGEAVFTATLEQNSAVEALAAMMEEAPVTLQMRDYSGFEKVGALGASLPTVNRQTTTQAGDIVLYQGNQIVILYGPNSWSYTRLGRIDDLTGWAEALGSGDVTVTFSMEG